MNPQHCKKHDLGLLMHRCFKDFKDGKFTYCGAERCLKYGPEKFLCYRGIGTVDAKEYYFQYNPWKLAHRHKEHKIFKYCVGCGREKITDEQWDSVDDLDNILSPLFCTECETKDKDYHLFIPECFMKLENYEWVEGNPTRIDTYGYKILD